MSKVKKGIALIMGLAVALSTSGCGLTTVNNNAEETSSYDAVTIENEAPAMAENMTNVSEDAVSHPTAQEIVDDMIVGWNLGNSLDSILYGRKAGLESETCWGNPVTTKELIDMVKNTGFNAIRVPITWSNHMDPITNEIDAEWMDRVEEVVNYVLDNDIYCIINVHHDTGEKGWLKASSKDLDAKKKKLEDIWNQIAKRFGAYDDKLLFEGFNEILDEKSEWVNPGAEAVEITDELNQIFVDTVRATGNNNATRCLLVNTYCSGGNNAVTKGFVLPTDTIQNKLIVEAHIYQPFYFVSGTDPKATTWKESKSTIDTYLNNMHQSFVKKGIPVIIGEFGCIDTRSKKERLTWTQYYMDKCDQLGIKCFWWDNGTDYKLFDRNSLQIAEPELIDIMLTEATGGDYVVDTILYGDADGVITNANLENLAFIKISD